MKRAPIRQDFWPFATRLAPERAAFRASPCADDPVDARAVLSTWRRPAEKAAPRVVDPFSAEGLV